MKILFKKYDKLHPVAENGRMAEPLNPMMSPRFKNLTSPCCVAG